MKCYYCEQQIHKNDPDTWINTEDKAAKNIVTVKAHLACAVVRLKRRNG